MSATEQLRVMLDERGVSHVDNHPEITGWWGDNDIFWVATEIYDDVLDLDTNMTEFTPDQAIAATLGAGTCKRVMDSLDPFTQWVCNQCGHPLDASDKFCSGCGRRVVSE